MTTETGEREGHIQAVKDLMGRVDEVLDLLDNGDVIEDLRFKSPTWHQLVKVTKQLRTLKTMLAEEAIEEMIDAEGDQEPGFVQGEIPKCPECSHPIYKHNAEKEKCSICACTMEKFRDPRLDAQVHDVIGKQLQACYRKRTVVERDGDHVVYLPEPGMYAAECNLASWITWASGATVHRRGFPWLKGGAA